MARRPKLVPVRQLHTMLERFGTRASEELMEQGMQRLVLALEAKAVELAPVDKGELQNSASTAVQRRRGTMVVGVVRFTAPHAAPAHELTQHPDPDRRATLEGLGAIERRLVGATRDADRLDGPF